ncbi:MAG: histidine phosphatase family protein [Spirochaetaceae bacterium]|nr:histidine phosphatase family protein [Spirochaetaceae bacterium]
MGRWFLVRHGETDWNVEGRAQGQLHVPLNDKGLAQAEAIAARLRPMPFTAVYASDLRRVTQTAEPIMRGRDVSLVTLPALRERGFGEWEGMIFTEMEARDPERYATLFTGDDTAATPGGESERQLYERVAAGVDGLLERHGGDDGDLLVIAHGGSLSAAIVRLLGLPSGSMERFLFDNCGLSAVTVYDDGSAALKLLNDTAHLGTAP